MSWAKLGAAVVALLLVAFLVMPQERLDAFNEWWLAMRKDPGQVCLNYERRNLKDPDSARLLGSKVEGSQVTISYKAKNGYGAYGQAEVVCVVHEGEVSDDNTQLVRKTIRHEEVSKRLHADIECLERRNALISKGLPIEEATRAAGGPCDSAKRGAE